MIISREQAVDIAHDASEYAGYSIEQYAGYYIIWADDDDEENNYVVMINKQTDYGIDYFAIYVSHVSDDGWWECTESLSENELVDKLVEIAIGINEEENKRLKTYTVEFTTTIEVEAEDEDDAVDLAVAELADDNGNVKLSNFYIYVNGKPYN